jgi:predicted RNA-binding protein with PIN domain
MPTRIFIDGYNLLWASDLHRPEAIRNFEEARGALIKRLAGHPRLARHKVTIVFDAHKTESSSGSTEKVGSITVQYSRGGQTADEVLREKAKQYGSGAIIVSSDREVARYAEKKSCGVLGAHEFDRLLEEPHHDDDWGEDEMGPDNEGRAEGDPQREANSKSLRSKKGPARRDPKARRRALARLR